MQHACFLLEVSDRPIQDIAQELGYEDAYYFSRVFKRTLGVAPFYYRPLPPARLNVPFCDTGIHRWHHCVESWHPC